MHHKSALSLHIIKVTSSKSKLMFYYKIKIIAKDLQEILKRLLYEPTYRVKKKCVKKTAPNARTMDGTHENMTSSAGLSPNNIARQ